MAKKEFTYKGKNVEALKALSLTAFSELLPANLRRSMKRGLTEPSLKLLAKLESGKGKLRTHAREMPILPIMIGKVIEVHNGKDFVQVHVNEEMLGHRLGELTYNRKRLKHSAPGIGATKSTGSVSVK